MTKKKSAGSGEPSEHHEEEEAPENVAGHQDTGEVDEPGQTMGASAATLAAAFREVAGRSGAPAALPTHIPSIPPANISDIIKPQMTRIFDQSSITDMWKMSTLMGHSGIADIQRSIAGFDVNSEVSQLIRGLDLANIVSPIDLGAHSILPKMSLGLEDVIKSLWPTGQLKTLLQTFLSQPAKIPPNMRIAGIAEAEDDDVLTVLLEGIPLAWVPRASTVELLMEAGSMQERRTIIGRRIDSISEDCQVLLRDVSDQRYHYAAEALDEAASLLDISPQASQALSAVVLDSSIWGMIPTHANNSLHRAGIADDRKHLTETKLRSPEDFRRRLLDRLDARGYIALAPVAAIHRKYDPQDKRKAADKILPNRHASLHDIGPHQYSQRNAAIFLMLATSTVFYLSRYYQPPHVRDRRDT
ncbi:hypothetical protein [Brachybacterium sp. p3-SID957]|uniref:hypothetical protein n=1 Tax=Brachybacterium sp. p3-SID957 TaxID=2916049 RepID=UPI00223BE0A2|nr:hypothetical protein [Brachybacterium sp. p3-SID957]MCT1774956.1 hypothetical protein [Brachybacterium sp. p3-SID957]